MKTQRRANTARKLVRSGPYKTQLNQLTREDQSAKDISARRQKDELAYTAWQQGKQGQLANAAKSADKNAARSNFATQIATAMSAANTQKTLDEQRGGRKNSVTSGPGNSRQRLAGDDVLTQSLLANSQKRQNDAAVSSQGKAGFIAAATAAAGQANKARISGELRNERKGIAGERRLVLNAREQAIAAAKQAQMEAEQAAADRAQEAAQAQAALQAQYDIANLNASSRSAQADADREADLYMAQLSAQTSRGNSRRSARRSRRSGRGGRSGGISASERRQRGQAVRNTKNAYGTLKGIAADSRRAGDSYSDAKALMYYEFSDYAENTAALNAALSAVYDPKARGGKPRGKALTNYQRALKGLRKGR